VITSLLTTEELDRLAFACFAADWMPSTEPLTTYQLDHVRAVWHKARESQRAHWRRAVKATLDEWERMSAELPTERIIALASNSG
jgi:hypothetical protein